MPELYWEDDKHDRYGVLVSHGYGAGWSTWNRPSIAYDRKVIEYWLTHKDEKIELIEQWFAANGYPNTYISYSNWHNLVLEWVPPNVYWRIREYDGAETIERLNLAAWSRFSRDGEPV